MKTKYKISNLLKKTIAIILIATLLIPSVDIPVKAVEKEEKTVVQTQKVDNEGKAIPEVVKELKNERTLDSNTYLLNNGMKKTVYYSDHIRYKDEDGKFKEYKPELVKVDSEDKAEIVKSSQVTKKEKDKYLYTNKQGDTKQYIPEKLNKETPIVMQNDDYGIAFYPVNENETDNSFTGDTNTVSVETDTVLTLEDEEKEKKIKAVYEDISGEVELSYESLEHGIKEDIILKEKPKSNVFTFVMTLENMTARLDDVGGGITIFGEKEDDIVAGIAAPFMNDASNNAYSEDIHFELEEKESNKEGINNYYLRIVASEEYLNDSNREYPVTIDPSITWSGTSNLPDVYVLNSSKNTNYYSSGVNTFSVGKGSQGTFRSYMRAMDLTNTVKGKYVESAILTLYENGANVKGVKIQVKPVATSFTCKTVTWNNKPSGASDVFATITSSGTADAKKTANLTTWARNIAKGSGVGHSNYGLILRAKDESVSSYVKFYGARTSATAKRPKLAVTYYDGPTTASSVTVNKNHIKGSEDLQVNWEGINSKALDYVQYRIVNYDTSTSENTGTYISYSTSTKLGTASSGSKIISSSSNWPEGDYRIYVRGVDKGGIVGTGKGTRFTIDRTEPIITNLSLSPTHVQDEYSDSMPKLTWTVNEKNISSVQVSVNGGSYKTVGTTKTGTAQITGLTSGIVNKIDVRAVDKAGNISVTSGYRYNYDATLPVITSLTTTPTSDSENYATEEVPQIKYSIDESTISEVAYCVNDSDWIYLSTESEGTITPDAELFENGENLITLAVVDAAGNENYEEVVYYRDNEKPVVGSIKVTPKTTALTARKALPVITWEGFEDEFLDEIQVSINGGEYKLIGVELFGQAQLETTDFTENGEYELKVRAVDKAGNVSDEISKKYYYKDTVSSVDEYTPKDVYTVERLGGNTLIKFSNKAGLFPGDIEYEVHRGTTPLFVPDDNTLVKTGGRKGAIEVSGDTDCTYYYKLRAITVDGEKTYSNFSDEIASTTLSGDEVNSRIGIKDSYEYINVFTPNGTGNIELSEGNFVYEQSDISLPAPQIPINISRVYNSKSSTISDFGYGWSSTYDMYVSTSKDKDKIYFQDGTKAVYVFEKSGKEYICNNDIDMELSVDDKVLERIITEIDENEKEVITNIEIDTSYAITTKENDVFYFDECGRLILVEESNDTFVFIQYDYNSGKIKSVVTSRGQVAEYTYSNFDENEYISKISIADGSYYSYEYENNRLIKSTHHGNKGGTIDYCYAYNSEGMLTVVTDAMGNDYTIEYVSEKISKFIYPNNESYEFSYNENETKLSKYTENNEHLYDNKYFFDNEGKLTEKVDALGNRSEYKYNENNKRVASSEDKASFYKVIDGVITLVETKKVESIIYDDHNNISEQTDKDGNLTIYTYDYTNDNTELWNFPITMEVKDANGVTNSKERYEYDENGNVVRLIDETTNTVTNYSYQNSEDDSGENIDTDGLLTSSVETLIKEDDINSVTDDTIKEGLLSSKDTIEYDNDGNVKTEESEQAKTDILTEIKYDAIGNVVSETDVNKEITISYEYDEFGRVTETTEKSKEKTTTIENKYDLNGTLIEEKDKMGRITTFKYDEMNRVILQLISVENDEKVIKTNYGYDDVSINDGTGKENIIKNTQVVTTLNVNDEVTGKTYTDYYGRTVRELSNGLYVDYTYDNHGRVFTTYTGGTNENNTQNIVEGKLSISTYDENGNQTDTIINPEYNGENFVVGDNSIITSNIYDNTGMLIKTIDAKGVITTLDYDEQGRLIRVNLDDGTGVANNTSYVYDIQNLDSEGVLQSTSDIATYAGGRTAETVMNGAGQITSVIDKGDDGTKLITSYEYDINGNKSKEIYNDGSYIAYEYDEYNNVSVVTAYDANGVTESSTQYTYDKEQKLEKTIDFEDEEPYRYTYYTYDNFGRNIGVSEINTSVESSQSQIDASMLKYQYDIDDNITKIYYPNSEKDALKGVCFKYNKDKWITEIQAILSGEETTTIRIYDYYSDGKIKNIKDFTDYLNGGSDYIQRDYVYDLFDRVISLKYWNSQNPDNILEQYEYTYDKNSNILSEYTKYLYENNLKDEIREYKYDNLNRLVSTKITNNLTYEESEITYSFDKAGNRISMTEDDITTIYTYNNIDQLTKSVETNGENSYTTIYEYDKKGNQVKITDEKTGTITNNSYDVRSQLTSVKITKNGEVIATQENKYNGDGKRVLKVDDGVETHYYYEGSRLLYTTDSEGKKTSLNVYGNQDNIISSIRYDEGQHAFIYSKDVQGSTSVIVDEEGECVISYDYSDYGETTEKVNTEFYNEICYTGGVYDELTGVYYLNARYYDPQSGVFLSQDTYRGTDTNYKSWNLYAYCAGNPITYIDPSGHWVDFVVDAIGLAGSAYAFIKDPSAQNAIFMAVDVVCMLVPVITGAGIIKATLINNGKIISKARLISKKMKKIAYEKVGQVTKKIFTKFGGKSATRKAAKRSLSIKKKVENTVRRYTKTIKCSRINPYKLETTHSITRSKRQMAKLVKDIETNGIQETIKYVKHKGKKYVVDGHHRLRAAKELRLKNVPAEEVNLPYAGYKTVNDLLNGD